jgi:hypothetical protein
VICATTRVVIPRRIADEMLELLRATHVNHGCHRSEGAVFRLRQSAQIAPRHPRAVARLGSEEPAIAVDEGREAPAIASTNDQLSHHPDIRLHDELTLSFRLPTRSIR